MNTFSLEFMPLSAQKKNITSFFTAVHYRTMHGIFPMLAQGRVRRGGINIIKQECMMFAGIWSQLFFHLAYNQQSYLVSRYVPGYLMLDEQRYKSIGKWSNSPPSQLETELWSTCLRGMYANNCSSTPWINIRSDIFWMYAYFSSQAFHHKNHWRV